MVMISVALSWVLWPQSCCNMALGLGKNSREEKPATAMYSLSLEVLSGPSYYISLSGEKYKAMRERESFLDEGVGRTWDGNNLSVTNFGKHNLLNMAFVRIQ